MNGWHRNENMISTRLSRRKNQFELFSSVLSTRKFRWITNISLAMITDLMDLFVIATKIHFPSQIPISASYINQLKWFFLLTFPAFSIFSPIDVRCHLEINKIQPRSLTNSQCIHWSHQWMLLAFLFSRECPEGRKMNFILIIIMLGAGGDLHSSVRTLRPEYTPLLKLNHKNTTTLPHCPSPKNVNHKSSFTKIASYFVLGMAKKLVLLLIYSVRSHCCYFSLSRIRENVLSRMMVYRNFAFPPSHYALLVTCICNKLRETEPGIKKVL